MRLSAKPIKEQLSLEIKEKKKVLKHPFLLVYDSENLDSFYYIKGIIKVLTDNDIPYSTLTVDKSDVTKSLNLIKKQASDSFTIIARPLGITKELEEKFLSLINPKLDPDMISDVNLGKLLKGDLTRLPATIQSVKKFIECYDIKTDGQKALVIGRSLTVGLPLALLLQKLNATVSIAHTHTPKEVLNKLLIETDILALGSGDSSIVKPSHLHEGEYILDCGYHDGHGDINFLPEENINYTPVPGGIGSLTALCLILNAITLEEEEEEEEEN